MIAEGRFGRALDARFGGAFVNHRDEFRKLPFTVECWVKLDSKSSYNILIANELKSSPTHWELFSMPGSGHLTVYTPGMSPDHTKTANDIADGKWHFVAMQFEPTRIRLFVDGKQSADQEVKPVARRGSPDPAASATEDLPKTQGELALGTLVDQAIGCDGLIDEVRLSSGVRAVDRVPAEALKTDDTTIALWSFDVLTEQSSFIDESSKKLKAWLPGSPDGLPASTAKKK